MSKEHRHVLGRGRQEAGFFQEDETEDDFDDALAALDAVEGEFGFAVEPGAVTGLLPTVIVPVRLD
ncbi:hypothetical protein [Streptomyces sp. NPDC047070]|uniref:hypothetical protein n=1 Tax=Streptomyces sp. NPDC047070 TaxID=3154923 RepID=UPI003455C944